MSNNTRHKRKLKKGAKVLIVFLIILAILLTTGLFAFLFVSHFLNRMNKTDAISENAADIAEEVRRNPNKDIYNFLLFGADRSAVTGDTGMERADATKLISLDMKHKTIKIASLQRDTMVWIPEPVNDYSKLNHAYWWGDADLAIRTVNLNFDMNVTRYVTFSMAALEALVDELGGVDIYLTAAESKYFEDGLIKDTNYVEGTFHLTGHEARAYAQLREIDNDYYRMNRQNVLIRTVLEKLRECSPSRLLEIAEIIMPFIETNFSNTEITTWMTRLLTYDLSNIETQDVPKGDGEEMWASISYNGYSPCYILRSYEKVIQDLYEFIYGIKDYKVSSQAAKIQSDMYKKFERALKKGTQ